MKLIIEKGNDKKLWGSIKFKNNLLIDSASTISALEKKMKKLLKDFHAVEEVKFLLYYI